MSDERKGPPMPEAARKIIENRRKVVDEPGLNPRPVEEARGEATQDGPPPSPPAAPEQKGKEPQPAPSPETPEADDRVTLRKKSLDKILQAKKKQKESNNGLAEENATLKEENAKLKREALKHAEKPKGWDDMSEDDKLSWMVDQRTTPLEKPTETATVDEDELLSDMREERKLVMGGFTQEEAIAIHDTHKKFPNADGEEVMLLAERRFPDLFSEDDAAEDHGGLPASHTTTRARSSRSKKPEAPDPRPDMVRRGKAAKSDRERAQVGLEMIRHARQNPVFEER